MSANPNGQRMPREERHKQVVALKQTMTFKEIAEHLGLAVSTVTDAYYDPTGEKARARKRERHGTCVGCGAETYNSGSIHVPERCGKCAIAHQRTVEERRKMSVARQGKCRLWTDEECFEAIRRVSADGVATLTRYKELHNAEPSASPSAAGLIFRFGSWR
jgi:hypothetical protein